ncbi:hypothetical protein ACFLZ1_03190 [Patescibacteria group bacterium]
MGKKKITTIDLSEKKAKKGDKALKTGKNKSKLSDMGAMALKEAEEQEKKQKKQEKELKKAVKKEVEEKDKDKDKKAAKKKTKKRSQRYKLLKLKVDRNKFYPLNEAIELLLGLANAKIDETVEIHLNCKEKLTGSVSLPHGTGKTQKVAVLDEVLITQISKGKINFDILLASPKMMPKIGKLAKILGPKGLMPNPKNGTITDNPDEFKKNLEKGEIRYKTENKTPLLHLSLGKISFGKEKIIENLNAVITAVLPKNIKKVTISATHSPGIKLDLSKFK